MRLTQLAETVAAVTGFDVGRVTNYCRYGREQGLFPTGGRGLAAAEVEAESALDLLVGLNLSDTASEFPKRTAAFFKSTNNADRFTVPLNSNEHFNSRDQVEKRLGRFAPRFACCFVDCDFRTGFGNLIRAEVEDRLISNFASNHNHILLTIRWPFIPEIQLRFRDNETELRDHHRFLDQIFHSGGVGTRDMAKPVEMGGEYEVTYHTREFIAIARGFAESVEE